MTEDVVSREAVHDMVRKLKRWCVRSEDGKFNNVGLLYDDVQFGIDNLHPAHPKRVKGKWKPTALNDLFICSKCGYNLVTEYKPFNFCPYCGADMRGNVE